MILVQCRWITNIPLVYGFFFHFHKHIFWRTDEVHFYICIYHYLFLHITCKYMCSGCQRAPFMPAMPRFSWMICSSSSLHPSHHRIANSGQWTRRKQMSLHTLHILFFLQLNIYLLQKQPVILPSGNSLLFLDDHLINLPLKYVSFFLYGMVL